MTPDCESELPGRQEPQIAFLLYDSRSGSTFLASLLDKTSHVGMSIEGAFLARLVTEEATIQSEADVGRLMRGALSDPRFRDWETDQEKTRANLCALSRPAGVEDVMRALLSGYFAGRDLDYYVVKGSGMEQYVPRLRKLFRRPKFIHIVRDPRGVYNSQSKAVSTHTGLPMANYPISGTKRWLNIVRKLDGEKDNDFLEIRYEDLVGDVEGIMRRVCGFLQSSGLREPSFDQDIRADGYYERIPENQRRVHANVEAGVALSKRSSAWREEISETDIHLIQTLAAGEMSRLGYESVTVSRAAHGPARIMLRILEARLVAAVHGLRRYAVYIANPHLLRERIIARFFNAKY